MSDYVGPIAPGQDRTGLYLEQDVFPQPYVMYDPATGSITQHGTMAPSALQKVCEMLGVHGLMQPGAYDTHFVDVPALMVRPKTDCPATLTGMALSNLPVPCQIEISNPIYAPTRYDWADSGLELSFDHPGTYTVRVLSAPHLPGTFTVVAA